MAPRADFISLKDEYRNMAGDKLPLTNDPLPNIQTNKAGFGTDLTVGDKYENLINIKGAKFLDLYRGSIKIDDADDLKEALKSYDVEMSIAFNDNPDNDEFRKAYIVVITNLKDKDTTTPEQPSTGAVQFAKDLTSKDGSIKKGSKVEVLAGGDVYASFTLVKPEWAYVDAGASAGDVVEITYDILVDGETYKRGLTDIATLAAGSWGKTSSVGLVGDKADKNGANASTEFSISEYDVLTGAGLTSQRSYFQGKTVTLVITSVKWENAAIKYVNGTTGEDLAMAAGADKFLPVEDGTGLDATIDINTNFSAVKGTYSIAGISDEGDGNDVTKYSNVAVSDISDITTAGTFSAKGGEFVVITITPKKATEAENYTITVSSEDINGNGDLATDAKLTDLGVPADGIVANETITLALTTNVASVKAGGQFDVTATLSSGTFVDTGVKAYKITIELDTGDGKTQTKSMTIASGSTTGTVTFENVQSNIEIAAKNVKVERIAKGPYVTDIAVSARKIVLTFSEAVEAKTGLAAGDFTGTKTAVFSNAEVSGKVVTVYFDETATLADAETVIIAEGAFVSAADSTVDAAACTITVALDEGDFSDSTFANAWA